MLIISCIILTVTIIITAIIIIIIIIIIIVSAALSEGPRSAQGQLPQRRRRRGEWMIVDRVILKVVLNRIIIRINTHRNNLH